MKFNLKLDDKEIVADYNNLPEQANGSILITSGDTSLLVTCVMGKEDKENLGFFPLTVEYEEKYYAAGKIKSSRFIKREGRPSDEAICNARLIDRAIRPLFPKELLREVQVIATVLSWDGENDPDILGILGASISLLISDIPWNGPTGVVRVCKKDGKFIINPTYQEKEESELDVVFNAVLDEKGELLLNMIEGNGKEFEEDAILEAFDFATPYLKKVINFQKEISQKIGKEKIALNPLKENALADEKLREFLKDELEKAVFCEDKIEREKKIKELKEKAIDLLKESDVFKNEENDVQKEKEECKSYVERFFSQEMDRLVHENILKYNKRPDGRKLNELRDISCKVGLFPRTHGSGLFCRGKTKALSILTLGSPGDRQLLEEMEIVGKKRFMHHYNFPPYCSGEIKPLRGPGRREIGHGMLAEKALRPLIPDIEEFPYAIRVVTEILSSNGSTSMASVCAASLCLMDGGVPIKKPAAGIAMGLVQDKETGDYKVLTDIQGPEDHHGDMDFKVAGTREGITAIQMDVKIKGITKAIMKEALEGARDARLQILTEMEKVIAKPRAHLSPYAPKVVALQIDPGKIGEVIGAGGKVINEIIGQTGATIDIEETGKIYITAKEEKDAERAREFIKEIVQDAEVGDVYTGKVKKVFDFGFLVEFSPNKEGLIHISKIQGPRGRRSRRQIKRYVPRLKVGDLVRVKVTSIDDQGRVNLMLLKKLSE